MHQLHEPWTANVVGRMHRYGISQAELANKCEYTPQYINQILNGKKKFSSDEAKMKAKRIIFSGLSELETEVRYERRLID